MLALKPCFSIRDDILPILPEDERSMYLRVLSVSESSDDNTHSDRASMDSFGVSQTTSMTSLFSAASVLIEEADDEDLSRVTTSTYVSARSSVANSPSSVSVAADLSARVGFIDDHNNDGPFVSFSDTVLTPPQSPNSQSTNDFLKPLHLHASLSCSTGGFSQFSDASEGTPVSTRRDAEDKPDDPYLRISIISHDTDGIVLLARDAVDQNGRATTIISSFHLETRVHTHLYTLNSHLFIVSASINRKKTLLAITTLARSAVDDHFEDLYESKVIKIGTTNESVMKTKRTSELQKFQFLGDEHMLAIYDKESISLHAVSTIIKDPEESKLRRLSKAPVPAVLVRKHVWFEWQPHKNRLYFLTAPTDRIFQSGKSPGESEHLLSCYDLTNPKEPKLVFKTPIMFGSSRISRHPVVFLQSSHSPVLWMNGRASPDPMMTIVEMQNNAVCLCRQEHMEASPVRSNMYKITLYLLHRRAVLSLHISAHRLESSLFKRTYVFFASLYDMLILYVPRQHLQFIDCGGEHLCEGTLIYTGSHATASEWITDETEAFMLVPTHPPDARLYVSVVESHQSSTLTAISIFSSTIYAIFIDKDFFLSSISDESGQYDAEAMHFAIAHLQDDLLSDQVILNLARQCPHRLSTDLLREYLIGKPYQNMKSTGVPTHLLRLLPLSSSLPFGHPDLRRTNNIKYEPMTLSSNTFFGISLHRTPDALRLIFDHVNNMQRTSQGSDQVAQPKSPSVRSLIRRMSEIFKLEDVAIFQDNIFEEQSAGPLNRQQLAEVLIEHFLAHHPKEARASYWAREYIITQSLTTSRLYKCIMSIQGNEHKGDVEDFVLFKVMENMLAALEELSCPIPKDFRSKFSKLAAKCLPQNMLLQYMRRGVVDITPNRWAEYRLEDPSFVPIVEDIESFEQLLLHSTFNLTEMVECTQHHDQNCIQLLGLCYDGVSADMFASPSRSMDDPDENITGQQEFRPLSSVLCQSNLGSSLMTDIVVSKYIHVFTTNQRRDLEVEDLERVPKFLPA